MKTRQFSIEQTRRIALASQGFRDKRPTGPVTARHFRRALDRMQVLQLDSVNVVCRSHFLPMFSRLGNYDREKLDTWLWRSGENLEYVGHEASITPVSTRPLLAHRFEENRWGRAKIEEEHPEYVQQVLEEVRQVGAISVRDLSNPGQKTGTWWGGSIGKRTLEWLYTTGRINICHRDRSFVSHYDVPERLIPEPVRSIEPMARRDAQKQLLLIGAKAHGIGTATDLADYFRIRMPEARPLLKELVDEQRLQLVTVDGWEEDAYWIPGTSCPKSISVNTLLTPFDPVVWFRPRAKRLFGFDYKIEIYTPESKRKYGYYVLPYLLNDRLAGRVDVKADRASGTLLAKACFHEPDEHPGEVADSLAIALRELASFLGLNEIRVGRRGNLSRYLPRELT
ncbi:winged helix-turn-helix domain-containing protein [Rhodopirellula halodulae]|uniref:winged helix-turn-helix domain-containing protein n=1 Tax=Rhodopirellula halodulae TaxID=2894198 RepID=UPI001E3E0E78|nr:crosslink repair DNA glycosylase YcaQ family protein [Rhodopirellula sp. JC737]MCC9656269.1 winged helix DNA-binding domain-containing protein [Rhodopirellula sp. JC737]